MFNSTILEVGIGLILIYLVFGLICTAINEHITQLLSMRAETLWAGIRNLLHDPHGNGMARAVYDYHLIQSLAVKNVGQTSERMKDRAKPSYIPSDIFSMAVLHEIQAHYHRRQETAGAPADKNALAAEPSLLEKLAGSGLPEATQAVLRPLLREAGDNLDQARRNIEIWYDAAMERTSGWYKQKVQSIILYIAFLLAFASNADTIMIANRLWSHPTERAALMSEAEKYRGSTIPQTTTYTPPTAVNALLGWSPHVDPADPQYDPADTRVRPKTASGWLLKLIGIFLTAAAASLGAPFWFDMLNKFMNVRAAGKSPVEKPAPPSTKPQPSRRIPSQDAASSAEPSDSQPPQ